ncbi:MAG: hypothetical protein JST80_08730 [Bdellovibrionales bacterium]|nr:hypothetical protein [Bdellovibrionales bacterium]
MNQKKFFTIFLAFTLLYKICDAFSIQTHGDAFYYHLAGAKTLVHHGLQVLMNDLQIYAQAGWFDLLYVIPVWLTSNVIAIQLIAQLMHVFAGLILGAVLTLKWIPNRIYGLLGAIAILTISRDSAFFIYAKNDGVVAMLTLLACHAMYKRQSPYWIGFLLGLLPSIKMSGLVSSTVLGLIYAVVTLKESAGISPALIAGLTAFAAFLPAMIKNYLFTGDPLFPGMVNHFPGTLSTTTQEVYLRYFSTPATVSSILANTKELFLGKIVYLLSFAIVPWKLKRKDHDGLIFFIAGLAIFFAHSATNGTPQGARFFFATFFLLIFFTFNELSKLNLKPKWNWALLALILVDSKIDMAPRAIIGNFKELATHTTEELLERNIVQMKFLKYIDPNPPGPQMVYSDSKVEFFHLHPAYRFVHAELSRNADFIIKCAGPDDVAKLDQFEYFILMRPIQNPCYDKVRTQGKLLGRPFIDDGAFVEIYRKAW